MLAMLLVACTESVPSPPAGPEPTSSSATELETTAPPGPLACTTVEGTRNVWVVSRADPSVSAAPLEPPDPTQQARHLVGPDALGRVYLFDDEYVLRRSDDDGCSWQPVWQFIEALRLWTSPETERLYAFVHYGGNEGKLWASDDGGELFVAVNEAAPGNVVGGYGPEEVRADSGMSVDGSTDGGETWKSLEFYPTAIRGGVYVDPSDIRRIACSSAEDVRELWLYDGTTWASQSPDPRGDVLVVSWKGDELVLLSRREGEPSVFLRSETGNAPFTEIAWGQLEDDEASDMAVDGPRLVAAGRNDPPGEYTGPTEGFVVTSDDAGLHRHEMPGFEDTVGIAVTPTSIIVGLRATPDIEWW